MIRKPKFEELEREIKALREELAEFQQLKVVLSKSERELKIRDAIVNIFMNVTDDEVYAEALQVVLEAFSSPHGTFGYIDENGDLVIPSLTRISGTNAKFLIKTLSSLLKPGGDLGAGLKRKKTPLLQ